MSMSNFKNSSTVRKLTHNQVEVSNKKRKLEEGDRIDPIEKLLSLNNDHELDINSYLQDQEQQDGSDSDSDCSDDGSEYDSEDEEYDGKRRVSLNFTKILNDNLVKLQQSNNMMNNFNSFGLLNKTDFTFNYQPTLSQLPVQPSFQKQSQTSVAVPKSSQIPFFKSVNFNPKPKTTNVFDELMNINDEIDPKDPLPVSDSEEEEIKTPQNTSPLLTKSKMCFNYRQYDNLNLSNLKPQQSDLKILNENSILSGKSNETIGSGNFLIYDFFL